MTWVAIGFRAISKDNVNPDLYHVPASKIKLVNSTYVSLIHSFISSNNKNTNIAINNLSQNKLYNERTPND